MKKVKKTLALLLAAMMLLALAACGGPAPAPTEPPPADTSDGGDVPPADSGDAEVVPEEGASLKLWFDNDNYNEKIVELWNAKYPDIPLTVENVGTTDSRTKIELDGPTGMGAAKMISDSDAAYAQIEDGTYDPSNGVLEHYEVTLGSDPANDIVPRLTNGELDIAAIPTNLAATLYNRTDGGIKLLALNTLGVLHILENGDTVNSLADLEGRTLYATGQGSNPEYVLNYLLEANGLDPAADVDIQWLASEELTARMASGDIDLCMLPVPAATTVMMQNSDVRDAIDLNDAWTESGAQGTFTMGCLVARTEWLEDNSELVPGILAEYAASIDYANSNPEEAAALIEQCGLKGLTVGGAQVSEKHAGFVINRGGATCADVLALVDQVKERVLQQTGVELEMEVRVLR